MAVILASASIATAVVSVAFDSLSSWALSCLFALLTVCFLVLGGGQK